MNTTPLDPNTDSRRLLGGFLRTRREAAVARMERREGLGRRRTPGLRREEVAHRADISTTWYTWLEQGRDMALSATALARVAEALELSVAERAYLFELARRRDPVPTSAGSAAAAAPELQRTVTAMPMPAYVLDRAWRLRAWNAPAAALFASWLDSGESCLLRYVFLQPAARSLISGWDERAHRLVAEFRADTALYPEDTELATLIATLQRESDTFARYWHEHGVLAREGGRRVFNHPDMGRVVHTQVTLVPASHADHKLVVLLPDDDID
jgi:transcriptional regulator with XRE-family HTH domain